MVGVHDEHKVCIAYCMKYLGISVNVLHATYFKLELQKINYVMQSDVACVPLRSKSSSKRGSIDRKVREMR